MALMIKIDLTYCYLKGKVVQCPLGDVCLSEECYYQYNKSSSNSKK